MPDTAKAWIQAAPHFIHLDASGRTDASRAAAEEAARQARALGLPEKALHQLLARRGYPHSRWVFERLPGKASIWREGEAPAPQEQPRRADRMTARADAWLAAASLCLDLDASGGSPASREAAVAAYGALAALGLSPFESHAFLAARGYPLPLERMKRALRAAGGGLWPADAPELAWEALFEGIDCSGATPASRAAAEAAAKAALAAGAPRNFALRALVARGYSGTTTSFAARLAAHDSIWQPAKRRPPRESEQLTRARALFASALGPLDARCDTLDSIIATEGAFRAAATERLPLAAAMMAAKARGFTPGPPAVASSRDATGFHVPRRLLGPFLGPAVSIADVETAAKAASERARASR